MERHETKRNDRARGPEDIEAAMEAAIRAEQRRDRIMIGAWVGGTVVALLATVMLLESCGGSGSTGTRAASHSSDDAGAQPVAVAASVEGAPVGLTPEQGLVQVGDGAAHDPLSVPPDVIAAVSDTDVTPGQPVEVTVEATPDVTEMALADGLGDAIPMVRDSSGLTWRANYRVPLRPRSERLGLSVTAKNQDQRWRRVWLFLEVGDGGARTGTEVETPVDSSGTR
jgi:hypothetical protein